MFKRFPLSVKIILGTVLMLMLAFIATIAITAFHVEEISGKFYSAELDSNSTNVIASIEKVLYLDDGNSLNDFMETYEDIYPYKIVLVNMSSLDSLEFVSKKAFLKIENSKKEGVITSGQNTYYIKIYDLNPYLYSKGNSNQESYKLILAKEVPFFSKQSVEIIKLTGLSFLLISIPIVFFLFLIIKRFTTPISKISKIAEEVANGNFSVETYVKSKDEIGDLSRSINNMTKKLGENERSREAFLAGVSHELRTPLTALKANTKGILDGIIPPEEINKYLISNMEEIDRLIIMVNDLILVSTIEKNTMLNLEDTDISNILIGVIQQFKPIAENKRLSLNYNIEEQLIKRVDKLKLKQVFVNIIDNAIKYSYEENDIDIFAKYYGDKIKIQIKDYGCGISEHETNQIFDRFYKGNSRGGLGLGLYISKLIVLAHNGTISAYNNEEQGCTFEVII